jgi:aldehyde dehydrogenase (NAD+)
MVSNLTLEEIEILQNKQRDFFKSGKTLDIVFRKNVLKKLKTLIEKNESEIFDALKNDLGKGEIESFTSEVNYVIEEIDIFLKNIDKWSNPKKVKYSLLNFPSKSYYECVPNGVCLVISSWNYPFGLLLTPIVGAIASGNCILAKPSEFAPKTSALIKKMINDNFDEGYFKVIECSGEETNKFINENIDHVFFTGSTNVGRLVYQEAAKHLIKVNLELGGKNPCFVDEDIDLEVAVKRIIWGKFFNSGQTCIAPDYILVHSSIKDKFIEKCISVIKEFYSDNKFRIINQRHFDRLLEVLENEDVIYGGQYDAQKLEIEPTICSTLNTKDEIFGPILQIKSYDNLEEELKKIDDPLSIYLFSNNKEKHKLLLKNTNTGNVVINGTLHGMINHHLPFGGTGKSGIGNYHGFASFEAFSRKKGIMIKSFSFDNKQIYPPYKTPLSTLKKLIKLTK